MIQLGTSVLRVAPSHHPKCSVFGLGHSGYIVYILIIIRYMSVNGNTEMV